MKILYISNQISINKIGNPVIVNLINEINNHTQNTADFIGFKFTFKTLKKLFQARNTKYNIVHVQFGGLYAIFAIFPFLFLCNTKRIITFHGTDIHGVFTKKQGEIFKKIKVKINQYSSFLSFLFFNKIGFVAPILKKNIPSILDKLFSNKMFIQKLGVDYDVFKPINQIKAKEIIGLEKNTKYFLFSSISNSPVKRFDRAQEIVQLLGENYKILELSGVQLIKVPLNISAADYILITSDSEGSPNIVREALAMNKPIFSVDVGDVKSQISESRNSYIISENPKIASNQIRKAMESMVPDDTRSLFESEISIKYTTRELIDIYKIFYDE